MYRQQQLVQEFHEKFDILIREGPETPDRDTVALRTSLIGEEFTELIHAMNTEDITAIADGIADLLYVVYGTAVSCGIDIEPIFEEVHRSNMTKVGGHKRTDGKWIKPLTYEPPNLGPILIKQASKAWGLK